MNQEEKDQLLSMLLGCGRAEIIIEVINNSGVISSLEEAFINSHIKKCEECKKKFKVASENKELKVVNLNL